MAKETQEEIGVQSLIQDLVDLKEIILDLKEDVAELQSILSSPTSPSCDRNQNHQYPDLDESQPPLSRASETRQPRERYSHETAYLHKLGTSRYMSSGNSQDTLSPVHIPFHQTSIVRESYAQLLSQILSSTLAQHGSSNLTGELFQVVSSLLSAPSLGCRVEQHEGHIRIRFLCESHPERVHSDLILPQNFHSRR